MRWVILFFSIYLSSYAVAEKYRPLTKRFEEFLLPDCLPNKCDNVEMASSYLSTTLSPLLFATESVLGTTDITGNALHEIIKSAKPDANAYVAVNGENYHTAKLELAFQHIKKHYPDATSMQMAQAIAAY